jgi:hypothetical protein
VRAHITESIGTCTDQGAGFVGKTVEARARRATTAAAAATTMPYARIPVRVKRQAALPGHATENAATPSASHQDAEPTANRSPVSPPSECAETDVPPSDQSGEKNPSRPARNAAAVSPAAHGRHCAQSFACYRG